jgi:5,10-methylene-tetrahydrofolate dehydrogenase/methenyl tetrahydrofolate cyclohydrolase
MGFSDIFKDKNDFNEKTIVGFMSFSVMSIAALADVVTGIMGQELVISDTVFNSFVIITLGAFGIAEAGKIFGDKKEEKVSKAKKSYDYEEEELG